MTNMSESFVVTPGQRDLPSTSLAWSRTNTQKYTGENTEKGFLMSVKDAVHFGQIIILPTWGQGHGTTGI